MQESGLPIEETFRLIVENAKDYAIFLMDEHGRIASWNSGAQRLLGYAPEEVMGRDASLLFTPEDRAAGENEKEMLLAREKGSVVDERWHVRADGSRFWTSGVLSYIRNASEYRGFVKIMRDFTDRETAREELRQSEERYRTLVEEIQDYAIFMLDAEGRIASWNKGSERITGYAEREVLGRHFSLLHREEDLERGMEREEMARALATGRSEEVGWRRRKDGSCFWGEETLTCIRNSEGEVKAFTKVLRDISTRKQAEEAQIAHVRYLEGMDSLSSVLEQNLDMEEVMQKAVEKLLGLFHGIRACLLHPLDLGEKTFRVPYMATLKEHSIFRKGAEFPLDGFRRDLIRLLLSSPEPLVMDGDTEMDGWKEFRAQCGNEALIAIALYPKQCKPWALEVQITRPGRELAAEDRRLFRDIAHRLTTVIDNLLLHRNLEASLGELRRTEEKFRQSQKMEAIGRLAGGVAHDFNNLLTAINGYSDLLLTETPEDDPRRSGIEEIRKAGERAASLTNQLLVYSRRQILAPKTLSLNAVVSQMETMLRRLIGEDIELEVSLQLDMSPVRADPGQLEQVILNLAVNARDAMPRGGRLALKTCELCLDRDQLGSEEGLAPGAYVQLSVVDSGIGMSEEVKSHLFEPFFTTKRTGRGTGLGLSTVYGIVRQSSGFITVESVLGQGTAFLVHLPAARSRARDTESRPQEREATGARGTETLLVAEDDPAVRNLVLEILRSLGYKVLEAGNGVEALEVASRFPGRIDLLLTDVVMSQMGGRELVDRMRTVRPEMRTMYMSGYTDDAMVRHGVLAKSEHFLQKPFTPAALGRKVREVLDQVPA